MTVRFVRFVRSATPYFRLLSDLCEEDAPYGLIENRPSFERSYPWLTFGGLLGCEELQSLGT